MAYENGNPWCQVEPSDLKRGCSENERPLIQLVLFYTIFLGFLMFGDFLNFNYLLLLQL